MHKRNPDLGLADPRFLADDMTEAELLEQYPGLTHEDVLAAIAHATEAARERVIPVPAENPA